MGDFQASSTIVGAVFIALAVLFTILRFVIRFITRTGVKWDDGLVLFAVLLLVATAILLLHGNAVDPNGQPYLNSLGNGTTIYQYTEADRVYMELSWISSLLYFPIAGATKLAILIMYNRIFSKDLTFRYSLYAVSSLVVGWWIGCTIASLLNCRPLYMTWMANGPGDAAQYCFSYNIFWVASGSCEVFIDVLILSLPIRAVWKLQLSRARKASVAGVFLLGAFVVITGLIRTIRSYIPNAFVPSDSESEIWGTVHSGTAIVCASLPIMTPLFTRIRESSVFSRLRSSTWASFLGRRTRGSRDTDAAGATPKGWHVLSKDKDSSRTERSLASDHDGAEMVAGSERPNAWEMREWHDRLGGTMTSKTVVATESMI